jgi:fatty acid amide hydrolase 2
MDFLLMKSACDLARMIRNGEITSRTAVDVHIEQIKRVNPRLNAMVYERFEMARDEADAADRALREQRKESLPLFHGVPCSIKESFSLNGMPHSGGLYARRDTIATQDATAVSRLRMAGAIPLGVTNVPELCMWMESNNTIYGRTNNPYHQKHTAGGSSGGEGAIVGAGGVPFGLGSDIGGSVRIPAFFNGVFGHKPTGGLVPNTGHYPKPVDKTNIYTCVGPLCRRAEDLWPLLQVLAGPESEDEHFSEWRGFHLGDPGRVRIDQLRVIHVPSDGRRKVQRELAHAQVCAALYLGSWGAEVKEARFGDLQRAMEIWTAMVGTGSPRHGFRRMMGLDSRWLLALELVKWAVRSSKHTFPAMVMALFDDLGHWFPARTARLIERGRQLRETLTSVIGNNGVMLYPSYVSIVPRHHKPMFPPFNWSYTAIFNVLEFPVTQVPMGLDHNGLPTGIQVVALPGNDHLTISVARTLEKAFGGWVPPWKMPRHPQLATYRSDV